MMKIKNSKFSIVKRYKECFEFIKETKNFIWVVAGLFVFFMILGFAFPSPFKQQIYQMLQDLVEKTIGLDFLQLAVFLMKNNIISALLSLLWGILFGVLPVISAAFNGYLVGFVAAEAVSANGHLILWKLLPHGIFELPAVFISMAMGLRLGVFLFNKKEKESFLKLFSKSLRTFFYVIIPLLVIAGFIESGLMVLLG